MSNEKPELYIALVHGRYDVSSINDGASVGDFSTLAEAIAEARKLVKDGEASSYCVGEVGIED